MLGKEVHKILIKQGILLTIVNKTKRRIPGFPPAICGNDGRCSTLTLALSRPEGEGTRRK